MKDLLDLRAFWTAHAGQPLVLATLVGKTGSTYRSLGAKKIIALDRDQSCGLLSGGCLEGDIAARARDTTTFPFTATFSTEDEADRFLGYQSGCAGTLEILFERLPETPDTIDLYLPFGAIPSAKGVAINLTTAARRFADAANDGEFFDAWTRPIQLTVLGCGIDAAPFAALTAPLGWTLRYLDYRPPSWHADLPATVLPLAEIGATIPDTSAVVLMTHSYEADLDLLRQLANRPIAYLACLGPRARYDQLKTDLLKMQGVAIDPAWEARTVAAPAGLWPRGRNPAGIALSVVAQIEQRLGQHET